MEMLEWAVSSAVLCAMCIGLRYLFRRRLSLRLRYALWGLALLRLLLPVSLGSSGLSVLNLLPQEPRGATVVPAPPTAGTYASAERTVSPGGLTPSASAAYGSAAAAPAAPERTRPEPGELLRGAWLAGTALILLWFLGVNLRFRLRLKRSRRAFVPAGDLPLPVYVAAAAETPCLFGLLRPGIYLPPQAAEDPDLDHILTHELTHFRHGDHVWSLLRCLALALHWYDPLVWWAAVLSRRDGELACDEGALRVLGEGERKPYGRTLIRMSCPERPDLLCTATTMTGDGLRERIALIARRPRTAAAALGAAVLIAALALGCTVTGAKKAPEYTDDQFIELAWSYAAQYAEANALDIQKEQRTLFRLADGRAVDVYFPTGEGGQSVQVTFIRGEDGTWTVREGSPKMNSLAFLDLVRNIPIEAGPSVPRDSAQVLASIWLYDRIMEWNEGYAVDGGVYRLWKNKIVKARIVGLTPMGAETAGLTEDLELFRLEYRLLPEDREQIALAPGMRTELLDGEPWITEWGERGQPYLLLQRLYLPEEAYGEGKTQWSFVCATDTRELEEVYGAPEMVEKYGSPYTAAAAGLYARSRDPEDRAWWLTQLGGDDFILHASGSPEEIAASWAEAYAARYTDQGNSPLDCNRAEVRRCEVRTADPSPAPEEILTEVSLALDARSVRRFLACYASEEGSPSVSQVYAPLEELGHVGWVGMDFSARLRRVGEELWQCVELGLPGSGAEA